MLSVSGARGIVGSSMTPTMAAEFAAAFGSFVRARHPNIPEPLICLGRDSRPSGAAFAAAAAAGLAGVGARVIDLGVVMTPTAGVMMQKLNAHGGMVVTASHNPIEWNGLKCLGVDGAAPPAEDAREIIRRFNDRDIVYAAPTDLASIARDDSGNQLHAKKVFAAIDAHAIRAAGFKVVLDSVNGAGGAAGRMLLESLRCDLVHLNGQPSGLFPHPPEPVEEHLAELKNITASERAACGFAQDPDADRLAIVDEKGTYIGEEYTLVLAAKRLLDLRLGSAGRAAGNGAARFAIAVNLSTSRMIDDLVAQYPGVEVVRTAVGEANVVAAMRERGESGLIGGEGNGGVVWPEVCWVRDSLSAMALVLSLMAADPRRRPLSQIVAELPRYRMIKHKFDLSKLGGPGVVKKMLAKVQRSFRSARTSTLDGVRLDLPDGWVHLRPSNTEPIIRLIAEAKDESRAWELIDEVAVAAGLR